MHTAQSVLEDVTASVGPVREQIVQAAANVSAQERLIEKLNETAVEVAEIQKISMNGCVIQAQPRDTLT